ncbi:MAG: hypothetical protein QXT05_03140, partial [Candidatus Bilamarchaeaceae archaeon]
MLSISLQEIGAYCTSRWCPVRSALNEGHQKGKYALCKCGCGFICNSDRKASLAVAIRVIYVLSHSRK